MGGEESLYDFGGYIGEYPAFPGIIFHDICGQTIQLLLMDADAWQAAPPTQAAAFGMKWPGF